MRVVEGSGDVDCADCCPSIGCPDCLFDACAALADYAQPPGSFPFPAGGVDLLALALGGGGGAAFLDGTTFTEASMFGDLDQTAMFCDPCTLHAGRTNLSVSDTPGTRLVSQFPPSGVPVPGTPYFFVSASVFIVFSLTLDESLPAQSVSFTYDLQSTFRLDDGADPPNFVTSRVQVNTSGGTGDAEDFAFTCSPVEFYCEADVDVDITDTSGGVTSSTGRLTFTATE